MGQRFHRGFTAAEKTELWDRWKRGESLKAIGRAFGKPSSSIYFQVAPHGGIRPAQRRRSRLALTLAEREVISRGGTARQSARSMAKLLGRSPSTVSREMSRNGGYDRYRAALADENAWARARRPKYCKLANNPRLRQAVAGKLRLDWSPEQIAGWLKRTHPEDECNQVSHETIYRSLFVQTRGVLKKELLSHLRSKRSMRRSKPVDPNGAAHETLLLRRRRELHGRVADALVGHPGTFPEVLAGHYAEAMRIAEAIDHWKRAGEMAVARSANIEAIDHSKTRYECCGCCRRHRTVLAVRSVYRPCWVLRGWRSKAMRRRTCSVPTVARMNCVVNRRSSGFGPLRAGPARLPAQVAQQPPRPWSGKNPDTSGRQHGTVPA
jgi:DNA-binding CsgD family transcriptional regulator